MGVVDVKSTTITNRDAVPQVRNSALTQSGMVQECADTLEITTANSSASTYRFFSIPSNARMSSLAIHSDDCGTATAADFGLYETTENGGAVKDADFFKAAQSLNGGALSGTELAFGNVLVAEKIQYPIWQALGLSADPCKHYDVCMTLTADSDVGGTVSLRARFVK